MKATELLNQQHRAVEDIFDELKANKSNASALLKKLADALGAHMAIEQNIFYPAVREADVDQIEESFEEHALAEIALKRLLRTAPSEPSFKAKLTALEELIEHHVEEEEEKLFPEVEKALGAEKLESLGGQMKKAFEAAKSEGFEALVPQGLAQTSADESRKTAARMKSVVPNGVVAPGR